MYSRSLWLFGPLLLVATACANPEKASSLPALATQKFITSKRVPLVDLYTFSGTTDGSSPTTGLIADKTGTLYGVTAGDNYDTGSAYQLARKRKTYQETTLYLFSLRGINGPLAADRSGDLFGTIGAGYGSVFELIRSKSGKYTETAIWNFSGRPNGDDPASGVIIDENGALYGTTNRGGSNDMGSAYKLTPSGSTYAETIIYSFQGPPNDGETVDTPLIADTKGVLYGTTSQGGSGCNAIGCGTVYSLKPSHSGYIETVIYNFQGPNQGDGDGPTSGLLSDGHGTYYGVTSGGGAYNYGTVYEVKQSGERFTERVIYSFQGPPDGAYPGGPLVLDKRGALYGTTPYGGTYSDCGEQVGCGTLYELKRNGKSFKESILYEFQNANGLGEYPYAGLLYQDNALFGTASQGGPSTKCPRGCGTVFKFIL